MELKSLLIDVLFIHTTFCLICSTQKSYCRCLNAKDHLNDTYTHVFHICHVIILNIFTSMKAVYSINMSHQQEMHFRLLCQRNDLFSSNTHIFLAISIIITITVTKIHIDTLNYKCPLPHIAHLVFYSSPTATKHTFFTIMTIQKRQQQPTLRTTIMATQLTKATYNRLNKDDAMCLLVDHQAGLGSLVRDIQPDTFKNNVLALAACAKYFKLPTILTTSFEQGPNGPLVPELKEMFPDAPYIARPGQINAMDNEDFVAAVKATGKKQVIIAGVVTEVCVAFPTLTLLEMGYEVFVVADASGTFNQMTRDAAWSRMSAQGAQMMTWFATACELHRDWRNDVDGLGALFSQYIPDYRNLISSFSYFTAKK